MFKMVTRTSGSDDYGVATLSKLFLSDTEITMPSLKSIEHF